jgi:hypothetical protein
VLSFENPCPREPSVKTNSGKSPRAKPSCQGHSQPISKKIIEWGDYLNERTDLLVSLKQAVFDAARQTIAAQLTNGDYAKEIPLQPQHCVNSGQPEGRKY